MTKKIILIAGPTASGKSKLAISLAMKIDGEIINADSMQVYREFKILSSRPMENDLKKVLHHLYGFTSVTKHFSTGQWLKLAKKKISNCIKNKKIPIIVGGTGLYFNSITKGMSKIPKIDISTRTKIRNLHKKLGPKKFYENLLILDPKVKNNILQTDTQRVLRAYEVKLKTKKSIYDWALKTKSDFLDFDIRKIYIDTPRNEILKKISLRTNKMINNKKCVEEVKNFIKLNVEKSLSANKLIGVSEISKYLKKLSSFNQAEELINIKTRQYAKRQVTWARGHMSDWKKLHSNSFTSLSKKILKVVS